MLLSFWNNVPYDFQLFLLLLRTVMRVVVIYIEAMWINYKMTYFFPVKTTIMTVNQLNGWILSIDVFRVQNQRIIGN